ncbi:MAG: bifunctional DNA-formamidopyrimidine glycosylase/DNA-(apurinic or apyrimidinic site) lyase [Caldilineaceae bacterium]
MPELPEVETALRELEPILRGRQVVGAWVGWPRTLAAPDAKQFAEQIVGARFAQFARRGKYLIFHLAATEAKSGAEAPGDRCLVVHLRMTGRLHVEPAEVAGDAHTHLLLDLDDGSRLHVRDPRKFGRVWLTRDATELAAVRAHVGPEPDDPALTPALLAQRFAGRKAPIKALLLDQSVWAGVGNIYADEALFAARIDPRRPAGSLSIEEVARLHGVVQSVLAEAIQRKGSSLGLASTNYQRPGGGAGGFQEEHRVFRRTGEPCPQCGTPIVRVVLGQRSTHFCSSCQV